MNQDNYNAHPAPGRKLLICEEALKDFNGHWYEYNKAVVAMNRQDGNEVTVLGHRELTPEIADELNGVPYFEYTNWDGIYYHPRPWRRYLGILRHNWRVWRAMTRYIKRAPAPIDCVFVPTVVIFHLIAWWFLAWRFGGKKVKRIVLLIRNSSGTYDEGNDIQLSKSARIFGFVLRKFQHWTDSGLVTFASDSHRLADEYRNLAGIEMTVLPHPCCLFSEKTGPAAQSNPDTGFTLVSPGPARWEKGTHLLLDAVAKVDSPDFNCKIQWPDAVFSPDGVELKPDSPHCEFLKRPLSSEDYTALLAGADCIVLPYLREFYFARISGVAVEAMLMGIPIIYTEDTWVSDMVSQFGAGLGFPTGDVDALAKQISRIAADSAHWKAAAAEKIAAATAHFSQGNFQSGLWEAGRDER